ncbi:hypothetical protein M5E89_13635 [Acidaminococcus intestini]|nr:hypothetical protein M5E89_13635 [Acidaminococcus intestini]
MGAETAHLDAVGNVVYPYQLEKAKEKPLLYTAHMDTVFEGVDEIVPEIDGHIMKAPPSAIIVPMWRPSFFSSGCSMSLSCRFLPSFVSTLGRKAWAIFEVPII